MALGLRDRDAIVSREGIIFRVYGYSHPPSGYICDVEYAPSTIYHSNDSRAFREGAAGFFFKFFEDKGLKFVEKNYPQYSVYHNSLRRWLVGVEKSDVFSTRIPVRALQSILNGEVNDELIRALRDALREITSISSLKTGDFGVFGSLLQGFYHPGFSDLDFTVIGKDGLSELREVLTTLYREEGGLLVNEFSPDRIPGKSSWKFTNMTLREYAWHQRRKLVYGTYCGSASKRRINIEFEPVKAFSEIQSEYDEGARISRLGWVEACGVITDDAEGGFMPSIYGFELDEASNKRAGEVRRIVSYVEEYRMQVWRGERVFVAGNLERVTSPRSQLYQITLTHGPRYYEQTLKRIKG